MRCDAVDDALFVYSAGRRLYASYDECVHLRGGGHSLYFVRAKQ